MIDKRKVSTDALETLGSIIDENEKRDAIHLAVEPTKAKEKLFPGQDVGIDGTTKNPVGIVDPFLKTPVYPEQWFWLVVYPRKITSLRHVWTHPDFEDEKEENVIDKVQESKKWIENYAKEIYVSYEDLMRGAKEYIEKEELLCLDELEGESTSEEFWGHYKTVTGEEYNERVNQDGINFFTCSC